MSLTKKLADQHEAYVAEHLGAHRSKSSGNQFSDQADGRQDRYEDPFAFAFDCKCAMPGTKSVSLTREMWHKLEDQSHGERPMMPVRFYATERGQVEHDLVVIRLEDFLEMKEKIDWEFGNG